MGVAIATFEAKRHSLLKQRRCLLIETLLGLALLTVICYLAYRAGMQYGSPR